MKQDSYLKCDWYVDKVNEVILKFVYVETATDSIPRFKTEMVDLLNSYHCLMNRKNRFSYKLMNP